ncbi:hypothetical protein T492DRAFT_625301 [Pavlovales sp. CCMP2436]|nr:hypothetical protein T492DRAFT_625301 [Pavlovales sp. CCMP2436]
MRSTRAFGARLSAVRPFSTEGAPAARAVSLTSALRDGPGLDSFLGGGGGGGDAAEPPARRAKPPRERLPEWLRVERPAGENYTRIKKQMRTLKLATVCEEARCPNIGECWGGKEGTATATIMVMGDTCTRGCRFCNVKTSKTPPALDPDEPRKTAEAIASWEIDYVVITSVDRDDLPDHGSTHLGEVIIELIRTTKIRNYPVTTLSRISYPVYWL